MTGPLDFAFNRYRPRLVGCHSGCALLSLHGSDASPGSTTANRGGLASWPSNYTGGIPGSRFAAQLRAACSHAFGTRSAGPGAQGLSLPARRTTVRVAQPWIQPPISCLELDRRASWWCWPACSLRPTTQALIDGLRQACCGPLQGPAARAETIVPAWAGQLLNASIASLLVGFTGNRPYISFRLQPLSTASLLPCSVTLRPPSRDVACKSPRSVRLAGTCLLPVA